MLLMLVLLGMTVLLLMLMSRQDDSYCYRLNYRTLERKCYGFG